MAKLEKSIGEVRAQLSGLGIAVPFALSNGYLPTDEEEIRQLLEGLEQAREVITHTTDAIGKVGTELERRLQKLRTQNGRYRIPEHTEALPSAPQLLGQFLDPVGDLNLLLDVISFTLPETSTLLTRLTHELIKRTNGLPPTIMEVSDFVVGEDEVEPRLTVDWILTRPPRDPDIEGIFQIAKQSYPKGIRGRKENGEGWDGVIQCRDAKDKVMARRYGIYFGPHSRIRNSSPGVIVSRNFASQSEFRYLRETYPNDWLSRKLTESKPVQQFRVEVRESCDPALPEKNSMDQAGLLFLLVQLGYFLRHGGTLPARPLWIEVFRALNRVGAEGAERAKLYGLRETLGTIERVLLMPIQKPQLARAYGFRPESVLLVGVPGVGKTLLAKFLMSQRYNAIFVAVDSLKLLLDLTDVKRGSRILLQIDKIGNAAGLPVVVLVDDVDTVVSASADHERDPTIISKLLNLFQGVREKGFFIIASTNKPEDIDERLLEPGRLSKIVHVPLPGYADRIGILTIHTEGVPFPSDEERQRIIGWMAQATEGWSGRYLWELVQEAGRFHTQQIVNGEITPLTLEDFRTAKELILAGVDMDKLGRRDKELRKFISQKGGILGFQREPSSK